MKYIYVPMSVPCPAWIFVIPVIAAALPFLACVYRARHLLMSNGQDDEEEKMDLVIDNAVISLVAGFLIGALVWSVCYQCYYSSPSTRERMIQAEQAQKTCFVEVVEIEPQTIYINADGLQGKQVCRVVLSNDEAVVVEKDSQLYKTLEKSDFKKVKMTSKDGNTWYLATDQSMEICT